MSLGREYDLYLEAIRASNKKIVPVSFEKYKACDIDAKDICNQAAKSISPETISLLLKQFKRIESVIQTGDRDIDRCLPRSITATRSVLLKKYTKIQEIENNSIQKKKKLVIPENLKDPLERRIFCLEELLKNEPDPQKIKIYTKQLIKAKQQNSANEPMNESKSKSNSPIIVSNDMDSNQLDDSIVHDNLLENSNRSFSAIFNEEIPEFESIREMLELFKNTALNEIKSRQYGLPDDCKIIVKPGILKKKFLEFSITEDHNSFFAHMTTVSGELIPPLDLYLTYDNQWLYLAQVYILCLVADMVKSRPEALEKSPNAIKNPTKRNPDSKTRNNTIIRRYPKTKGTLRSTYRKPHMKPNNKIKPTKKTPYYVPWHYRKLGDMNVSARAREKALLAGITSIPKGLTFVEGHWRGLGDGEKAPVIVKSFLADSLTKSLDNILS